MNTDKPFYELDTSDERDPDATPIRDRKVITQPYDLGIDSIVGQVKSNILFLRPLSDRPKFQRQYVWSDRLASKLVESVLLNVPIPPCYLSENEDCELDVIDGQQRIYSLYRFLENQFKLSALEALTEYNGLHFFELPGKEQRKIKTHTLRCVVITNESHPEIKFDVFERLNTNTIPLNAQELRNCVSRGSLNNLLAELSFGERWLQIRGRKSPDKRLADEEMILRYFSFQIQDIKNYKTPLKTWLNETARMGRKLPDNIIQSLGEKWNIALSNSLHWFEPNRCFRRPESKAINRALFDLVMRTATTADEKTALARRTEFLEVYNTIVADEYFQDLISRAVDHKSRTEKRFDIWNQKMAEIGL
ncbi:DUF262 domain-containing protein [Hoeflea poritis]|uniref:DUF262 domain-containing protein n=1 Tax=Hoeflea poritis TaxID=2993659 RepID=A0ABT4VQP6_9HYPH|nr:DUF262 domain-containing protein [Hoeflea poritis]MDA4847037.1 DUF262 domain-containing protein [Hoeflea poritis]